MFDYRYLFSFVAKYVACLLIIVKTSTSISSVIALAAKIKCQIWHDVPSTFTQKSLFTLPDLCYLYIFPNHCKGYSLIQLCCFARVSLSSKYVCQAWSPQAPSLNFSQNPFLTLFCHAGKLYSRPERQPSIQHRCWVTPLPHEKTYCI